jgi:hypothetical protein
MDPYYFYGDLYIECGNSSYSFDKPFSMYGFVGERYMCSTSVTFSTGSSDAVLKIPDVSIVTDDTWLIALDDECFTRPVALSPPSVPVPVTLSPVSISSAPITAQPMSPPIRRPSVQPVDQIVISPVAPQRGAPIESTSSNGAPVVAVVGGIIGGMVVLCLVAIILVLLKRKNHVASSTHDHSNKPKPSTTHSAQSVNDDHDASFSQSYSHDVTASNAASMNTFNDKHYSTPMQQLPLNVSVTTPVPVDTQQPHYAVNYKDQARTVIAQQQQQQSISIISTELPVVMAVEGSTRAEPPGRQFMHI